MQIVPRKRHPWLAGVLSLVMPGLGQLYCGAFVRCLVFLILCSGSGVLGLVALLPSLHVAPAVIVAVEAIAFAMYIISAIDAYRIARRTSPDYRLKDYNRWYAYAMLYVAVSAGHLFATLYARDHLVQPFRAGSNSMYPTITTNDQVLADKNAYATEDPARGDVVTFRNPQDRSQIFVKRVIAVSGDEIEIRDGIISLNGTALAREPVAAPAERPDGAAQGGRYLYENNGGSRYVVYFDRQYSPLRNLPRTIVPPHTCFVLGDNRDESLDSRTFGPVPIVGITGKVQFRYAPLNRIGTVYLPRQ